MSYQGISDFRSDTVTRPTPEMRRVMSTAPVGDDVHGDDPTVNRLQELAAEMTGKEAAIFVPSGTMGNTIALILGVGEGMEVIMEEKCHIFNYEAGNVSRLARSLPRILPSKDGAIPLELLESSIHTAMRVHCPPTRAICLENTHNLHGGTVLTPEYMRRVKELAVRHHLHVHLDGARVFNASVALGVPVAEIAAHVDTMMFCLSKGLCAPIGSLLVGDLDLIREAVSVRKYLGGAMRQAGIVAAAGILSLQTMVDRLAEDHERAAKLARGLEGLPGVKVDMETVQTNFVMLELEHLTAQEFLERLKEHQVWALPFSDHTIRFCIHNDIDDADVDRAIDAIAVVMKESVN